MHSTNHAIISLIEKVNNALDSGKILIGVFLDLKKAFDTVDHCILLDKLYKYGIRGTLWDWFKSYLENRKQYVCYSDISSVTLPITHGVPQGSILGPLLFILYINDLAGVSEKLFTILFADDTTILIEGTQVNLMITSLHSELAKLTDWLKANKLSINVSKTHYMVFQRSRRKLDKDKETKRFQRSQPTRCGTVYNYRCQQIEINTYPDSPLFISTGFLPRISSMRLN